LCTAIVGGALIPLLVGKVSEFTSYHAVLVIPAVCYATLCMFAIASRRANVHLRDEAPAATIH
jgi:FHS family L-fucose permease-like MFS transporter